MITDSTQAGNKSIYPELLILLGNQLNMSDEKLHTILRTLRYVSDGFLINTL